MTDTFINKLLRTSLVLHIYDVKKFKKIGIKTIKKEDKMVAIVKMVEQP